MNTKRQDLELAIEDGKGAALVSKHAVEEDKG